MTRRAQRCGAFILLVTLGCTSAPPAEPARSRTARPTTGDVVVAIVGANVIAMTDAGTIRNDQTVIVSDGRIAAVGARDEIAVPAGAKIVDATGKYLIPGLADMHVHLEYFHEPDVLALFLAHGVTLVRNMDGRPYIIEWRDAIAAGELPGPEIITAGPLLDGTPPILPDNTVVETAEDARAEVKAQAAAGYDFVKVYSNLGEDAYGAIIEAAEDERLPVSGHIPRQVEPGRAIRDLSSVEHLADYGDLIESEGSPYRDQWHWSKLFVGMPIDEQKLETLANRLATSGVWTVPTLVQSERGIAPPDMIEQWLASPELRLIPEAGREQWRERLMRGASRMDDEDWGLVRAGAVNRRRIVAALHRAGANLMVGTDTPNPFVVPGHSVHEELELLVASGLTPGEALLAATRAPAQYLGRDDFGTIEPGNEADLVLLENNPLENIRATRDIAGVMLDGRWASETSLGQLLELWQQQISSDDRDSEGSNER